MAKSIIQRAYPYFLIKLPLPSRFIRLTPENAKDYLLHGRIIYSLVFRDKEAWVNSDGSLRYRWEKKGWYFTKGEPPFRTKNAYEVDRPETEEEYKEYGKGLLKRIAEGFQYVDIEEPLVLTSWANRNSNQSSTKKRRYAKP